MLYYRARTDSYDTVTRNYLVKNQLLTEIERKKNYPTRPDFLFKQIELNKIDTYWSFGVRFQKGTNITTKFEENDNGR